MSDKRKWSGVEGCYVTEITREDAPEWLQPLIAEDGSEMEIVFESSGYYEPARTYGDPGDCYPAEGDDEREVTSVIIDGNKVTDKALIQKIADKYQEEINGEELESLDSYDDGPDPDEEYEDYLDREPEPDWGDL